MRSLGGTFLSARILIVSVLAAASDRIANPLTAMGHAVTTATTPAEARREMPNSDLVIVDARVPTVLVDACRRLRAAAPPGLPMLAVAHSHDIEERISLIEAGADDVLGQPFDVRQLELLTEALLSRLPGSAAGAAGPDGARTERPTGGSGKMICFVAAKGGVGTTTLAVNTAIALANRGQSVAIADLDFHHGQVAAHLNVASKRTTAELAAAAGDPEEVSHALADVAIRHASGVVAYPAPERPDQGSALGSDEVIELVRTLRATHPLTIVDAGSVPGTRALALLGLADQSVIIVSPDIPGLRALAGMQAVMADNGIAGEQNHFVVNRTFAGQTIGRADIEGNLGVSVSLDVPFDGDSCLRAVNQGEPVVMLSPRSPVTTAVNKLAGLILGEQPDADPATPAVAARRRLGTLLNRRNA